MQEIWKDVPNYEGRYLVSNTGKVYSVLYKKELSYYLQDGYKFVKLQKQRNAKNISIHRLVAITFIPNVENKKEVNHIDGNKLNNSVNNLEWCTHKENVHHAINTGLRPLVCKREIKYRGQNKTSKPIIQLDLQGNFIKRWDCSLDIEDNLGFMHTSVLRCCRGERKTHMGYKWKFAEKRS